MGITENVESAMTLFADDASVLEEIWRQNIIK